MSRQLAIGVAARMVQIFSPVADTWLRLFLIGGLSLAGGSIVAAVGFARSAYMTETDLRPHQPVPFSHRHHAGELGIDCRYCHSNVEAGPQAGLPPTETCMTCHSQIWTNASMLEPVRKSLADNTPIRWTRVAKLPDYVFFRHDIHIAKGVGCESCHGRIDRMALTYRAKPFTMQFCIDCHRDPAPSLRDPSLVTKMDLDVKSNAVSLGTGVASLNGRTVKPPVHCSGCHR